MSDLEDFAPWEIPYVEDPRDRPENKPTNALNKRSDWKYEPPEVEEEIRPPTAVEIEAIRQAAYEEGFAQGKTAGYEEGLEQGKETGHEQGLSEGKASGFEKGFSEGETQVNELTQQWQALVEQLHHPLFQVNREVKTQVSKLAVTLARAVIHHETATNEKLILSALEKGIAALPINESKLTIALHPDDIERVKHAYSDQTIDDKGWELVANSSLTAGGCEIIAKNNAVDVSIEKRCRAVLDNFLLNQGLADE